MIDCALSRLSSSEGPHQAQVPVAATGCWYEALAFPSQTLILGLSVYTDLGDELIVASPEGAREEI